MIRNANTIINDIYEEHQPGVQMNAQGNFYKIPFWVLVTSVTSQINSRWFRIH